MGVDFSASALIKEIQIQLRGSAGVSHYDREAPCGLPSLSESIAGADDESHPHHVRCRNCRGHLLRGTHSLVCIYCGAHQHPDPPPPPISFPSTLAFRHFLHSLGIDGSEVVTLGTAGSDPNKRNNALKDGMVLSELLNLEIRWTEDSNNPDASANNVPTLGGHTLNLAGVDLDNFFDNLRAKSTSDIPQDSLVSSEPVKWAEMQASSSQQSLNMFENLPSTLSREEMMSGEAHLLSSQERIAMFENLQSAISSEQKTDRKAPTSSAEDSLSLFENIKSSDQTLNTAVTDDDEFGDFSNWEADFRSSSSVTYPVNSNEPDPSLVPSASNLSIPLEASTAFDSGVDSILDFNNTRDNGEIGKPDTWIQDDTWHANDTKASNQIENFESFVKPSDWTDGDIWRTSTAGVSNDAGRASEADGSSELWNDFASSEDLPEPLSNWPQTGISEKIGSNGNALNSANVTKKVEFDSFLQPDLFSGAPTTQEGSIDINTTQLETSPLGKMVELKAGSGPESKTAAVKFDKLPATGTVTSTDPNVEMLISQTQDLSFMLENTLSVPKKVESTDSIL